MHDGADARLDDCDNLERPEMPAQSVAVAVGGPAPRQGCSRRRKWPGGKNRSRLVGQSGSIAAVSIEVAHVRHGPAIVRTIRAQGASVKASPIDTDTAAGECFLDILGVANSKANLRYECQLRGSELAIRTDSACCASWCTSR
jgi:hypothetical protein